MRVRDALGEENSRSRLTTGMPAVCALRAISVSAFPSKGRMTSASTFLSISVWTWLICWLTSLLPSTACRVTSLCLPAWLFALVVMAAIQPWSAAGAEKPIVTALPGVSLPLPPEPEAAGAAADVVEAAGSLLVQAASAAPAPIAPTPNNSPRRPRTVLEVFSGMTGHTFLGFSRSRGEEASVRGSADGPALEQGGGDDDRALGD